MSDLELLAVGAYSPLEGFMGKADYQAVLHEMRLASGLPWTLPITLAVGRLRPTSCAWASASLVTPWEEPIGILHLEERFPYDGREEARLVYGTNDPRHPGAQYQLNRGEILLAGPVDLIARPPLKGFEAYRLDPAAARQRFQQLGWRTVVGFQSQQPMHRAHEYIQKCALEPLDGLFIHLCRPDQAGRGAVRSAGPLLSGAGRAVLPEDPRRARRLPGRHALRGPRGTVFHAGSKELRLHPLHRGPRVRRRRVPSRRSPSIRSSRRSRRTSWASSRSSTRPSTAAAARP